jgi:hypothetical protein
MTTQGKIRERLQLSASSPTVALWILVLALGAGTAVMSLQAGSIQWDGVVATAIVVGVIWILARFRGWHFWPW